MESASRKLSDCNFYYDKDKYPTLSGTENFEVTAEDTPINLAEALLWKLGRWEAYTNFRDQYGNTKGVTNNNDVVFSAYAEHLKNPKLPIYDQHTIRALWTIDPHFTAENRIECEKLLFKKDGTWKDSGTGSTAVSCYELYRDRLTELTTNEIGLSELDKLLMPLGQAIKKTTKTRHDFYTLCLLYTSDAADE